jgi:hypothetical protein
VRAKLIVALPFAIGIAAWHTQEYLHLRGALGAPVVDGVVIRREEFRRFGGIPAGRLSIRIVGTDTVVIAETNKQSMQTLPGRVRFHYTGDPGREVFVEGEGHPLWVALFLWVFSVGIVAFCIVPLFRREALPETPLAPNAPAGEDTRSV